MKSALGVFAAALVTCVVMARLVRDVANARGWATEQESARHINHKPVPRLGGVAILGSLVLVVTIAAIASNLLHLGYSISPRTLVGLLGPTLVIFGSASGLIKYPAIAVTLEPA